MDRFHVCRDLKTQVKRASHPGALGIVRGLGIVASTMPTFGIVPVPIRQRLRKADAAAPCSTGSSWGKRSGLPRSFVSKLTWIPGSQRPDVANQAAPAFEASAEFGFMPHHEELDIVDEAHFHLVPRCRCSETVSGRCRCRCRCRCRNRLSRMLDNDYDYDNNNEPPRDFCTAPLGARIQ
jgi:hypothetical protein